MSDYNEETFEPVEDTPVMDSETEEKAPEETQEIETPEVETPETDSDNDAKRYAYWQSEAYKKANELAELKKQLEKDSVEEEVMPQRPDTDDPEELIKYNAQLQEFLLKQIQKQEEDRQKEKAQIQQMQQMAAQRQSVINELTRVTKNPQKAQKILNFFADTQNLQDPALFQVMYDAAIAYKTGQKGTKGETITAPPPPIEGGSAIKDKKTPDDVFNEQLGQANNYRL